MSQSEKAARLEDAVINISAAELPAFYKELGEVEFSARALGLACRFRGVEMVRVLCECGAAFDIPYDEAVESEYHVYSGVKYANYRSNFALYLLNVTKQIKGACCCKGLKLLKQIERADKTKLKQIPDSERAEVLRYLCENSERLSFEPSELLFLSIFARDDFIFGELKKLGVKLSEKRINIMVNGGLLSDMYWFEYCSITSKLSDEDYLPVMEKLAGELEGKRFHCTEKIYELAKKRFSDRRTAEFFFEKFEMDKLNKLNIMRGMIDANAAASLSLAEKAGWLENNKRRDDLIEYARKNNCVECAAWLLDFKNRTADLAAEQARAEKKMNAELNASPNSVLMLKKIWSYRKREQGDGLVITSYKGTLAEISVPETIGKSTVVEIGNGAFAGSSGSGGGIVVPIATAEQMRFRMDHLTKVTLPNTIKFINTGAFNFLRELKTINIPEGVEEIGAFAFQSCYELEEIVIPGTVKRICMYAFSNCAELRRVKICEGVEEIGAGAFSDDMSLKEVELPRSLKKLHSQNSWRVNCEVFTNSTSKLIVKCPKGSYAEEYCKEHGIRSKNI